MVNLILEIWEVWWTPSLLLLTWNGSTSMSQINLFKNYLYLIGPYAKKNNFLKKQLHKKINVQ